MRRKKNLKKEKDLLRQGDFISRLRTAQTATLPDQFSNISIQENKNSNNNNNNAAITAESNSSNNNSNSSSSSSSMSGEEYVALVDDILMIVFFYLKNASDIQNILRVNQRWKKLLIKVLQQVLYDVSIHTLILTPLGLPEYSI